MDTDIKKRIMRRTYAIWAVRQLASPIFLKGYAIAVVFWGMTKYISFRSVWGNIPAWNDTGAQYDFISSAFVHTEIAVWILLILSLGFLGSMTKDILTKQTTRM